MAHIVKSLSIVLIVMLSCVTAGTVQAQPSSQFGRYLGVLKHSQVDQDQLAKLDFIVNRQNSSEFKLIAVLSL